jgi:hypothetical protein
MQWEPDGQPHVPGNLDVWKQIINQKTESKVIKDWAKRTHTWDNSEQLLEAMTAFSRLPTDSGPLQVYLMMNVMDMGRPAGKRLSPETVRLLANKFSQYSSWYLVFSEFPDLDDPSIVRFLNVAESIDKIQNQALRGNVQGAFQANIGLWQILARQGEIPKAQQSASWQKTLDPFAKVSSPTQLFDAAHASIREVLLAAGASEKSSQDEIIEMLAGPPQQTADGQRAHL